jgi:hypothetical protein
MAVLIGRAVAGFDGIVLAMAVAHAAFVALALRIADPGAAAHLLRPITTGLALVSFGVLELVIRALGQGGPVAGIVAALAATLVYAVLAARIYPDAARTFARLAARK